MERPARHEQAFCRFWGFFCPTSPENGGSFVRFSCQELREALLWHRYTTRTDHICRARGVMHLHGFIGFYVFVCLILFICLCVCVSGMINDVLIGVYRFFVFL